jgi:hypothetical protein
MCCEGLLESTKELTDTLAFASRLFHSIELDHATTSRDLHNRSRQSNAIAINRKRTDNPF